VTQIDKIYRSSRRDRQIDGQFVEQRSCTFGDVVWQDNGDINVALGRPSTVPNDPNTYIA
jgi:hypothetical protein